MVYNFEWDPEKAKLNIKKHSISFEVAATVFKDRKAISIFDFEHSAEEDRLITLGIARNSNVILVVHTYFEIDNDSARIRIISARKATKKEQKQYLDIK